MSWVEQTSLARDDIESAFVFLLERNPSAAYRFKLRIARAIRLIAARPLLGRPRPSLHTELRSFVIHPYVLFYLPMPVGIRIVRFLHGARDIEAIMRDRNGD
jgi:toxin ParE1/3/4